MRKKAVLYAAQAGAVGGAILARADLRRLADRFRDPALIGHGGFLIASMAGWIGFSLYWEISARNAAAAKASESSGSRAVHVFLTNAALLLIIAPVRGLGRFLPVIPGVMLAGLAVEALGLAMAIWARRHLGRNWSGEITIKVDHQLIRTGPYRLLRHPIYTGLLAMYAGATLVTGEWLGAIGLALALFAYARKIRLEEANLRTAFGAEYEDYRRASWALVPGLF